MSLPEILTPAGTPTFLQRDHARTRGSLYVDLARGTGHGRRRRTRTAFPQLVEIKWFIESDIKQTVERWYEETLRAGTDQFSAQIARIDSTGLEWWTCQWDSPPTWTPLAFDRWEVSGRLRLTGVRSLTAPVSTSAAVEFTAALVGTATPVISSNAEVEFSAVLGTAALGAVEFTAALMAVINGAPASTDDLDLRWTLMGLNYAPGYVADTVDDPSTTVETATRSYVETREC